MHALKSGRAALASLQHLLGLTIQATFSLWRRLLDNDAVEGRISYQVHYPITYPHPALATEPSHTHNKHARLTNIVRKSADLPGMGRRW